MRYDLREYILALIYRSQFTTQFIYDGKTKILPELQFVNALIDKKVGLPSYRSYPHTNDILR